MSKNKTDMIKAFKEAKKKKNHKIRDKFEKITK